LNRGGKFEHAIAKGPDLANAGRSSRQMVAGA
jgi:hypothetical protein